MYCIVCESVLVLEDIEFEKHFGLASIFYIKCRQCKQITGVPTDIKHQVSNQSSHFDCNTKAVIGVMNSGIGNSHLNKVLTAMNIPEICWKTYQSYQGCRRHS
ncbi:uncharacterized protein LOC116843410 [Odontomachus brunneus]|uniref:uncharacterized protein LOC116843410 n=1 Tax=Odontomachus brunneus TaxID=486640 RepID=UPI0013F22AB1|nr:uncharacterized protein LOC116843410 [Odontomachus brunneus]